MVSPDHRPGPSDHRPGPSDRRPGPGEQTTPPVLDVLARRRAGPSRPGARSDSYRVALVIEGGGSRAAFSTGMIGVLHEYGLLDCFDAVYGSSAGALNGAWLLCGRAPQAMDGWTAPGVMRRVMDSRRVASGRPVVDLDYLINEVYSRVLPIDFLAVLANPITLHPLATAAADGGAVDLAPTIKDVRSLKDALRATSCLPVMAGPPVKLTGGQQFLDGGVAEPIPIRTALAQGATHALVLRTRRADEHSASPGAVAARMADRWFRRHAPGALAAWAARPARAAADERFLAEHPGVMQIRPSPGAPSVSRIATDPALLGTAVAVGHAAAAVALAAARS